jgi:hypothetical protein
MGPRRSRNGVAIIAPCCETCLVPECFWPEVGSLYRWLLPQLDACAIERVLGSWVQATTTVPADEPLALDGKTVRGARAGEQTAPHLLAFCTHHSQETFWQVRVDEKTNEIPVAKAVLPTLPIRKPGVYR